MPFYTPREVDRRYTRKLKEDILRKGLIDTYALYRSIDVTAEIDLNFGTFMTANYTFTVKIYAEPYLVYLNERFSIVDDFVNSRSFANTTEILNTFWKAYLQNEYPLLRFDNVTLDLYDVIIMNQP